MSYFAPTITENGMNVPTYNDIEQDLIDTFKQIYGDDIYLGNDSQDMQLISAFALKLYDIMQFAMMVYNNAGVQTAIGTSLDRLVALNGISRKPKTYSSAYLTITGTEGTVINYGLVTDQNNNIWQLPSSITIDSTGSIKVRAYAIEPGTITAPANSINVIATPTRGWNSVTNEDAVPGGSGEYANTVGDQIETDSRLKARQKESVMLASSAIFESIIADIEQLSDVTKVTGYENMTSYEDDRGISPHSIAIVAEGGDNNDIANIIYRRKAPGCGTYGTTSVSFLNDLGIETTINFSRPQYVATTIVVNMTTFASYSDDNDDIIKNAIVEYIEGLKIGEDAYISRIYPEIMSSLTTEQSSSFYITSMTINSESSYVEVDDFEVLQCDASDITLNKTEA